jgi:soluble lytic murein transglycosylase-like protein
MILTLFASIALAAVPAGLPDAVAVGDCPVVVTLSEGHADPGVRLVRARCLRASGRAEAALESLLPVPTGILGAYARLEQAEILLDLGRPGEVGPALSGVVLPGESGLSVRLVRARALIAQKRSLEAREDLRALLQTPVADEARWLLGRGALDRGDTAAAMPVFRTLWATSTRGTWSDQAANALKGLASPVPDPASADGRALVRQRIAALDEASRYAESLALRRLLLPHEAATTPEQRLALARANFRGRDYAAAVALFDEAHGTGTAAKGSARDLFDHALATSRIGRHDDAAVLYRRLIALHPADRKADEASYKLGYVEVDRGAWDAARTHLAAHIRARPDSAHLDEAWWWIGWSHHVQGRPREAIDAWARLVQSRPSSSLVPAARYWSARAFGTLGDPASESAALRKVLAEHPTTGYGWYAAERLQMRYPARPRLSRPAWPGDLAARAEVQRFETLLAVGLQDEARAELLPVADAFAAQGKSAALATAWALVAAGAYQKAQVLARPYCTSPGKTEDPLAEQACWPLPAWAQVDGLAPKLGVPRLVPYGIMVTESALDPSVTSMAGARGLMQLMPDEAAELHRSLYPTRPWHPDLLFSAPYNATLGVSELGQKVAALGDVLDGPDIVAAIAAYNGGESAVRRWVEKNGGHPAFDAFAEEIGFTETRRYVRSVLGTVMAWRLVYGDLDAPPGG